MYSCTHVFGEVRQFQDEFTTLFCHVVPHNSHNLCHQYKVQLLISSLAWFEIFNLKPTCIEKLSENPSWFWGHTNKWKGLSIYASLFEWFFQLQWSIFKWQHYIMYSSQWFTPTLKVWNTQKRANICKLLGHYLQKEVSHLALYNSLILLIEVKTFQLTKWKPTTILNKLTNVDLTSQVVFPEDLR